MAQARVTRQRPKPADQGTPLVVDVDGTLIQSDLLHEAALQFVARHPLIQHKLSLLRDRSTPTKIFKELVDEIAMLMAYEATSNLDAVEPRTRSDF